MDKDIPKDKPFNPSITLNECVTPVVANIVNNMANGDNKKVGQQIKHLLYLTKF